MLKQPQFQHKTERPEGRVAAFAGAAAGRAAQLALLSTLAIAVAAAAGDRHRLPGETIRS